jgi:hypothetical protein
MSVGLGRWRSVVAKRIICRWASCILTAQRLFSCCKAQGPPSEFLEVGDLPRWQIKRYKSIVGLFSHHGGG